MAPFSAICLGVDMVPPLSGWHAGARSWVGFEVNFAGNGLFLVGWGFFVFRDWVCWKRGEVLPERCRKMRAGHLVEGLSVFV